MLSNHVYYPLEVRHEVLSTGCIPEGINTSCSSLPVTKQTAALFMYIQLDPMIFDFCYQLTAAMIHNIHTIYICKRTINHKKQQVKLGSKNKKALGQSWAVNMAKIHKNSLKALLIRLYS